MGKDVLNLLAQKLLREKIQGKWFASLVTQDPTARVHANQQVGKEARKRIQLYGCTGLGFIP
jgi:exoribonuclease II